MSNSDDPPQAHRGRRRWYQFGLSALLIATALIAILIAWQRSRIDRWVASLRGVASPTTLAHSMTVVILPNGSLHLDGDLLLENNEPLAVTFAARFQDFQRAGIGQPKVILEADVSTAMIRVQKVLATMQQAGFCEFALRPHADPKPEAPLRAMPQGKPPHADE